MSSPSPFELAARVRQLANNLWWTWNPTARALFEALSPAAWRASRQSAPALLARCSDVELTAQLGDASLRAMAERVWSDLESYLARPERPAVGRGSGGPIAFFSPEFAFDESLPIYSGGLGVLAGDFIKAASDLALPLVGIGILYRQGYMTQRVESDGRQRELYPDLDLRSAPLTAVLAGDGNPLEVSVEIGDLDLALRVFRVQVGRIEVYLLDASHHGDPELRAFTARLYSGGRSLRIAQEIILGIGGLRALRAIGRAPSVFHLNEGHSAFLVLELMREAVARGLDRGKATASIRSRCLFTTHTPVEAGHDRFERELVGSHLARPIAAAGFTLDEFMSLGRVRPADGKESFCMTVIGLRHARAVNAVSELHGRVTRDMWKALPRESQPPIGHVTNGVHTATWTAPRAQAFWRGRLGPDWVARTRQPDFAGLIAEIPDTDLWALRAGLRRDLVQQVNRRARRAGRHGSADFTHPRSADALTLGFARRFASYKRATLLFTDPDRLSRLVNNRDRPVQIVFAGKAHPADRDGKRLLHQVSEMTAHPELAGRLVLLENYDMRVGRLLVSGSDVWLNTPLRNHEASGTSGMKTAVHGCLNVSTPDGWWREGFAADNGWQIGRDTDGRADHTADGEDADALYSLLENEIVPMFYRRDGGGIPVEWVRRMRRAMVSLIARFSAERMVSDYLPLYADLGEEA